MNDLSYEPCAEQYDIGSAKSPFNRLLERPAVQAMLGDLASLRVLEAGCAGGRLTRWMVDQGAQVVALDISPTLVRKAKERVPSGASFRVHDIRKPLDFVADASIDVVVASLVMQYIEDWSELLGEFHRVLRPGGRFVMSTGHPFADLRLSPSGDYHVTELVTDEWTTDYGPPPLIVRFYRKPLAAMTTDILTAGFMITAIEEPRPGEADREAFGPKFDKVAKSPWFLCIAAVRDGSRDSDGEGGRA
jgi:SAM-dependent methyltransferase